MWILLTWRMFSVSSSELVGGRGVVCVCFSSAGFETRLMRQGGESESWLVGSLTPVERGMLRL